MEKRVLVPLANGSEDLEAAAIVDVLRRSPARVTVASVDGLQVTGSKGLKIMADCMLDECAGTIYDLIALPGGMPGAERLRDAPGLAAMLAAQREASRLYGAICAAPAVTLDPLGILDGRRATCHPSFAHLMRHGRYEVSTVVVDGPCVTSRGAGTVIEFSLTLVELLFGPNLSADIAAGMVFTRPWR